MRGIARVLEAIVLFFALALAPSALAQSIPTPPAGKPTAADEATAKRNFESGLKLYGEGSYAEALVAFEQSYRLGGRPSALKNIAQCHRSLKHFVESYEALEQMLARHDAQLTAPDKKAAQQAIDELGVLTATVQVEVSEPDADIEIDGKSAGKSPMAKPKRLAVTGAHTLRVTKPGFAKVEQSFNVDSQQTKKIPILLEAEKTVGHVVVREQNGRDVHVLVDGQDRGAAPWEGDLGAGEHTVQARSPRYASDTRKIIVVAKERADLSLDAAPLQGRLRVTTVPATASIAVDGNAVGTGAWEGELAEGPHRIEVSLNGEPPQVREIVLGRGQLVVQEIPIVSAIAITNVPRYPGIFVRLAIFGQIALGGPPDNAVEPFTTNQGGGVVLGAGGTVRVGRMWDWYGAEAVGLFMFEHRSREIETAQMTSTGQTRITDVSEGVNAFFGIGPRVASKDDTVRFTFGIAPGLGIHTLSPRRKIDGGNSPTPINNPSGNRFVQTSPNTSPNGGAGSNGSGEQVYASAGYTAFGFLMDGGILVGSTPGTKFYLGIQAWLDFAPKLVTGPDTFVPLANEAYKEKGRGIVIVDGTQFYVGPTLGLQFGH